MPTEPKEDIPELALGTTIKRLRQDCDLTQVSFAEALGLTPASVYRYEAGTTKPSPETLAKLYRFAVEHQHGPAEFIFQKAMMQPVRCFLGAGASFATPVLTVLQSYTTSLSDQQFILLLALARLLSHNPPQDKTVYGVLRALLEPHIGEAEKDLEGAIATTASPGKNPPADERSSVRGKKSKIVLD